MSASPAPSASGAAMSNAEYLSLHNQHDVHKPFKRVQTYSTSSSGRKRNYKQIISMEQEASFDLAAGGSGVVAERKSKTKKKGGSTIGAGGAAPAGALVGAAAKAAKRKEDRLKREAAQAQAAADGATPEGDAATNTGTSTPAAAAALEDVSMADIVTPPDGTTTTAADTPVEEDEATRLAREAFERERLRKMALPTFSSIEAPPSLRPAKKYCDVTGLLAPYTDPKTGLHYHSAEIYEVIKTLGPGMDQAYLALRGKVNTLV